jgi:hypothetical protein
MKAAQATQCQANNARGERCGKRAVRGRFCLTHAGVQNIRELGRRGGRQSPQTKLRKSADDDLREQARETLSRALRGEDVPKQALDAARSLFSYRADSPPQSDPTGGEYAGSRTADGRRPTSLAVVVRFALSITEGGAN